jgi:hypothetical protein
MCYGSTSEESARERRADSSARAEISAHGEAQEILNSQAFKSFRIIEGRALPGAL